MPDRVVVYTLRERSEKDRHEKHLAVEKTLSMELACRVVSMH